MRAHKIRFFSLLRSFDEFYLDGHKPNGDGIVAQLNTVEPSSFVHTWWVSIYFSYVWRTERALLGARIMEWKWKEKVLIVTFCLGGTARRDSSTMWRQPSRFPCITGSLLVWFARNYSPFNDCDYYKFFFWVRFTGIPTFRSLPVSLALCILILIMLGPYASRSTCMKRIRY